MNDAVEPQIMQDPDANSIEFVRRMKHALLSLAQNDCFFLANGTTARLLFRSVRASAMGSMSVRMHLLFLLESCRKESNYHCRMDVVQSTWNRAAFNSVFNQETANSDVWSLANQTDAFRNSADFRGVVLHPADRICCQPHSVRLQDAVD